MQEIKPGKTDLGADIARKPHVAGDEGIFTASATDTTATAALAEGSRTDEFRAEEARRKSRWGPKYSPELHDRENRGRFAQICSQILLELEQLRSAGCVHDGEVSEEGAGSVVEINRLLEQLFDCPFGDGESLKGVVVAIQSQTNNITWTENTVGFLQDVCEFLQARYLVNSQTVDEVYEIMKERGLDRFRGVVSDAGVERHYRLVEMDEP